MYKFLFLFALLLFFQSVKAQEAQSTEIDQKYSRISFAKLVENLTREHHINIIYRDEWVKELHTPEIDQPLLLGTLLDRMLSGSDLHFIDFQGNIVIMPGRKTVASSNNQGSNIIIIGNPLDRGKYKKALLTGTVFDGKSKTPIPGAQVYCQQLNLITTTNSKGEYQLELPVGNHRLKFSFMGLSDEFRDIELYSDGPLEVELYEKSIDLEQINVMAERPEDNFRSTSMGMIRMNMKTISKLSVLMGEPDVIKSMVMLPGVQSTGENASGFNVRGGNIDQNLILIDEVPVYNTAHLFGLFSMLDGGLVKDVTLYKSGIPSRFGGRIASVMDIELNKGKADEMRVNGGIGLVNSRLSIEGPLGKKTTYFAGARTTYSDWIMKLLRNYELQQSSASFADFNAKIDIAPNARNKISLFAYGSNDDFNYFESAAYRYGNMLGSMRWSHLFNNHNSGNLRLNLSRYQASIVDFSQKNVEYQLNTAIQQEQLGYHFSSQSLPRHHLNMGFNSILYHIEPGNAIPYNELSVARPIDLLNEQALELAVYAEDEFDLSPELALIAGLRYSAFLLQGPDVVNLYPDNTPRNEETIGGSFIYGNNDLVKSYHGAEPRIALRYEMENSSSVKLGLNRTRQYIRQISNSASITPADYWKASDPYLKPLIADQLALGYFRNFDNNQYETSLEIYYKDIRNEVDYKNGARIILNENLEQVLINGIGQAYGAELMIKKNKGKMTGWLAYTYSRSFKKIDGAFAEEKINNGRWYKSNYDKPHDLTLVMNYKLSRRFTFSSNFTYSTGRPVTLPEEKYQLSTYEMVAYSERNKYRLPDYHRLDVAITYEGSLLKKQAWRSSWTLSVYNLYGRNNAFSVYYDKQKPSYQNDYRSYSMYKFAIIGVPVPSFTYNFWF